MSCEFRVVYPNQYEPDEQEIVDKTLEFISGDSEKLEAQLDDQLKNKTRGIGNMELNGGLALPKTTLGSSDLLATARSTYPLNPLYCDEEYAISQKGRFEAAPLQVMMGPSFPYIPKGLDLWISNADFTKGRGLDHEYTYYRPVYAGDTIRTRLVSQGMHDVSEGGDTMRKFRVTGEQAVYNQDGELLSTCWNSAIETFKVPVDVSKLDEYDGLRVIAFNGYANWDEVRPRHVYTSDDWEHIRSLWDAEVIRGEDTLFWDDVSIGDMPSPTCDGPFGGRSPGSPPGGMSGPTVRDYICGNTVKDMMGNPMKLTAEQNEWGEYTVKSEMGSLPGPMRRPGSDHPNYRPSLMNTVGRDSAARFITNWLGNKGFLHKLCWRLAFCWDEGKNVFPADHDRPSYLLKVPFLKEQGRFMNTHSYTGDLSIVRGYVCDKYIKDGKHYIDIPIWIETIEGDIWAECFAVVELPSRNAEQAKKEALRK